MSLKKILTIFLAALMLSSIVFTAKAENTDIFKVGVEASSPTPVSSLPEIYNKGDEITVKLRANQNTGITSIKLLIDYDETLLEVVEGKYKATNLFTESDKLTSVVSTKGDGYLVFVSDNYPNISENEGIFAEITFLVKNLCSDETAIEVSVFGNENNCVKNTLSGVKTVPYEFEKTSFAIHGIDKSRGVVTAPTCTEDGYTTYQCTDCGKSVVGNITPAKKHTESKPVQENIVSPTCTKEGSYDSVVYCSDCHTELSRVNKTIPVTEHKAAAAVEENKVEPTCTKEGSYDSVVYCSDCHAELSRVNKTIPVTKHKAAAAVEENKVEPTCTKEGSYDSVVYCSDCHAELSRENVVINALGHDLVHHDSKAPTCTDKGYKEYDTCSRCDYTTYEELVAIGHKLTTKTTKATISANGSIVRKCATCGKVISTTTIYYPKTVTLSATSYTYDGKVKTPAVTVKGSDGKVISSGNYSVAYASGRTNVGTYKVTVTFKNNYSGSKALSFKINAVSSAKCSVKLGATSYTYDGKVKTPTVTVKNAAGKVLKKNTDYTVTYATGRKNVGTYKVTVKFKGNYTGTKTASFVINPPKTSLTSVVAGSKRFTAKWTKKSTQVTGYQIQYATSSSFKSAKTVSVTSYKTVSKLVKSLKGKTRYYVRVRTYKTVGKTKYYSSWSTYKKVTTKK